MKAIPKGAWIAHYRILEPLGAGGMGTVYKAHDEKLDRLVAVKLLGQDAIAHEDRRRRFFQEARAASALNHPHILTIYDIGESEGKPFIAMEYIRGETIRHKIAKQTLTFREALDIACQVGEGLVKAHEHGIVHRDLKPENLMVTHDGYAKILDFGLAKLIGREKQVPVDSTERTIMRVHTKAGAIMGTIHYMSPEQILGRKIDQRCDVFSFGIVLYEMATGQRPFSGENDIDTMHAILHEEARAPHAVKTELPRDLHRILTRALAKLPKDRYQLIRELCDEIKELRKGLEPGAARPATRTKLVLKTTAAAQRATKIDYAAALNEAQYEAVTSIDGPLLIVAGAGTGKTRTLVYRLARLIETGIHPASILLVTFTRRAAASMLGRAAALADERCQKVSGGTFHSLAYSVLRRYGDLCGVSRAFTVLDQGDTEDIIELTRKQLGFTSKDRKLPRKRTIGSIFSMAVNKLCSIREVLEREHPQYLDEEKTLERLFHEFEQYKRDRHLLSYDDLLMRFRDGLDNSPELREKLCHQYRYVMVDEYQDTNKLQAQIIRLIAGSHSNVAVVGDECQSIYSFRGASFHNMIEFPDLFPGAKVIKLEENFRSTQPILDLANALQAEAKEGYAKRLFSQFKEGPAPLLISTSHEHEQSRFIVQRIEELREEGLPWSEIAVLFRASSHSFDLEIELARHRIPFRKFGGIKFAESAHIKDVLAFLRVVANPSDTLMWRRALKLVDNVGDVTVEQVLEFLSVERREFRTAKAKVNLFRKLRQFPARASYEKQLLRFANLLMSVAELKTPRSQLAAIERFYRPILQGRHDDHLRRQRELEHMLTIAKRYKSAEELLADVALDPVDMAVAESTARDEGFVTLSTVHSAKGLEWNALFVIWMIDGWFPAFGATEEFEDLEEEKRLLYVAATRAKQHLYFTSPRRPYERYDSDFVSQVSQFLEPISPSILTRATVSVDE